jgi:LysM repeat protein
MRKLFIRTVWIAVGLLVVGLMAGCTLTGAQPAPQTTLVGDTGLPTVTTPEPTQEVIIIPTTAPTVDVFGTIDASTATASVLQGTPGAIGTGEASTTEPGGAINATATPTTVGAVPTATLPGQPTSTGTTGECPPTHTVAAGENLFRIALKYGIDWHNLATANGITNEGALQIGQVLNIPGCQQNNAQPTTAAPGATPVPGSAQSYTVQQGDNLFRIALKFGITWQELAAFNNITDPASLQVGQVLQIPAQ